MFKLHYLYCTLSNKCLHCVTYIISTVVGLTGLLFTSVTNTCLNISMKMFIIYIFG